MRKELDDCHIKVHIKKRSLQIEQLGEKLASLSSEFKGLKQADVDYEGSTESEREIKVLVAKIEKKLCIFEMERDGHAQYQKTKLEAYTDEEIFSPDNAHIVKDIRLFKEKIEETTAKLEELEGYLQELNDQLIAQDMNNATSLITQQSTTLKQRLKRAHEELQKISSCGDEMEGNASHNDEEEFVKALQDEMPDVYRNIDHYYDLLDAIEDMTEEVLKSKSLETMHKLKSSIKEAHDKVELSEGLVNKLKSEIVEWDAHKKLCRRDEELGQIQSLLEELKLEVKRERTVLDQGQ